MKKKYQVILLQRFILLQYRQKIKEEVEELTDWYILFDINIIFQNIPGRMKCYLKCVGDSRHDPIEIKDDEETYIGRLKSTEIKDVMCSRNQGIHWIV